VQPKSKPYKIFIAYIGNDYGKTVARSVDKCLWKHHWIPRIALSGAKGEFFAIDEHEIIEEGARCDALLAINSEGAINRSQRLKFWLEVAKLLLDFYKPTVALIQRAQPTLHYLDNPEVRHVKFERGHHRRICTPVLAELEKTIQNWARTPVSTVPLGAELPEREI